MAQGHQPAFDLDLKFGQEGERFLLWLADESKVEVKRERDKWATTGNLFFEYGRKDAQTGEKVDSGLTVTKSEWWAHCLHLKGKNMGVILFPVDRLKLRLRELHEVGEARSVWGGDDNRTVGILCPLRHLDFLLK